MKTENSKQLFEEAKKAIPGGVNSPVRAFGSVKKDYPIFIERAKGSKIYDEDGNEYIDCIGSWGPMILGHNYPEVLECIKKEVEKEKAERYVEKSDILMFLSSSTFEAFAESIDLTGNEEMKKILNEKTVASIGPVTTKTIEKYGIKVGIEAEKFTEEGIVDALLKRKQKILSAFLEKKQQKTAD